MASYGERVREQLVDCLVLYVILVGTMSYMTLDYIFLLHFAMLASGTYYSRLNVGCTYVAVP